VDECNERVVGNGAKGSEGQSDSRSQNPDKPKGKEWSDLEDWWNHLSDEENGEAMRELMSSFSPIPGDEVGRWAPKDANEITTWDNCITVVDHSPLSKNIPQDLLSADMRKLMENFDKKRRMEYFSRANIAAMKFLRAIV
jgi:hypothetical protein